MKFDIPAQAASAAIPQFSKQANVQVMFVQDELKDVQANAVTGEHEPLAALHLLVKGTGLSASPRNGGWFAVVRTPQERSGSIEGSVREDKSGRPVGGAKVVLVGTGKTVLTDPRGRFVFAEVPAGEEELLISAEGMQDTKVTDVTVKPGHRHSLSAIGIPVRQEGPLKLEPYVVSAKKNDGVIELDPLAVEGRREKPFVAGNMDIRRTINDAQPYYIFDHETIDRSAAVNIEDFLKQRLTMNASALSNAQAPGAIASPNTAGNTSSINLRGLGTDSTLILVNGRRVAGVGTNGQTLQQPDLNGIPMSAIERIEVLPSSASGIYGGSAVGGVVNVILKHDYTGGELRASYDNTWDTAAPRRSVALSYGAGLEGGKTHLTLSAAWSDSEDLLMQDRRELLDRGIAQILQNYPAYIYGATSPFLGALPNITPSSSAATTLVLKSGVVIPSRRTFVPAGTSPGTSRAELNASLLANAGGWNFDLPVSTMANTGLLRPLGANPETRSVAGRLRRSFGPNLELFADYSRNENKSARLYNPHASQLTVSAASPVNPFTTNVRIRIPDASQLPLTSESTVEAFSFGAVAKLPWDWTGQFDYTRSESSFGYFFYMVDSFAVTDAVNAGTLNPFVDTLLYPLDLAPYLTPSRYAGSSVLDDLALRGSGPLPSLPWGTPSLTFGLEHREASKPENNYERPYPFSVTSSMDITYFARKDVTDSGYAEGTLPLVKQGRLPLVHALDLQVAGRSERYTVDTGSSYLITYPGRNPVQQVYQEPTLNGEPYRTRTSYVSTNSTVGLKYQPVADLTLRASHATAFLPPYPSQLVRNPMPDSFPSTVRDPRNGLMTEVETISGGNPDLKPQNSKSWNAGVIWAPRGRLLEGLRVNAQYYRIEQFNAVGYLNAQQILEQENLYPGRVTRNAAGEVTRVDISNVNLFRLETDGIDLNLDYRKRTPWGVLSAQLAGTVLLHLKTQYSVTDPAYDGAGYPGDGGAAKLKANGTLTWEWRNWAAGWTTYYYGPYKQYGAAGGPNSRQYAAGGVYSTPVLAQGGDTIPAQVYHDLFTSYAFGSRDRNGLRRESGLLGGLTLQVGVKNVFGTAPRFDANGPFYTSTYGDIRLRSYTLSVRKSF